MPRKAHAPTTWPPDDGHCLPPEIGALYLSHVDDPVRQIDQTFERGSFWQDDPIVDQHGRKGYRITELLDDWMQKSLDVDGGGDHGPKAPNCLIYMPHRSKLRQPRNELIIHARLNHLLREKYGDATVSGEGGINVMVAPHDHDRDMVGVLVGHDWGVRRHGDRVVATFIITLVKADGRRIPITPENHSIIHSTTDNPSGYGRTSVTPAVVENQRYIIIVPDARFGPVAAPEAFRFGRGFLEIDTWWKQAYADGRFILDTPEMSVAEPGVVEWRFSTASLEDVPGDEPDQIAVAVRFVPEDTTAPDSPAGDPPAFSDAPASRDPTPTIFTMPTVPDEASWTIICPHAQPKSTRASLVASRVMLARMPAREADWADDLATAQWIINLDETGALVRGGAFRRLGGIGSKPGVWMWRSDTGAWTSIAAGQAVPLPGGGSLAIEPPPKGLESMFHGQLAVRQQVRRDLGPGVHCLGRAAAGPDDSGLPMVTFGLLELAPLVMPGEPDATLERFHLSRRHASLELVDGRLAVRTLQAKAPLWHIRDGEVVACLAPSDTEKALLLEPGDDLVCGCYRLTMTLS